METYYQVVTFIALSKVKNTELLVASYTQRVMHSSSPKINTLIYQGYSLDKSVLEGEANFSSYVTQKVQWLKMITAPREASVCSLSNECLLNHFTLLNREITIQVSEVGQCITTLNEIMLYF